MSSKNIDNDTKTSYEGVSVDEIEKKDDDVIKSYGFGVRHIQALLVFIYLIVTFIARGHLGVTIVAMVDPPIKNKGLATSKLEIKSIINNNTLPHYFKDLKNNIRNEKYPTFTTTDEVFKIDEKITKASRTSDVFNEVQTTPAAYMPNSDVFYELTSRGRMLYIKNIFHKTTVQTTLQTTNDPYLESTTNENDDYITRENGGDEREIENKEPSSFQDTDIDSIIDEYTIQNRNERTVQKRSLPIRSKQMSVFKLYQWPKSIQESVQGAFFFGYFLLMLPMGMLCQRFGGKIPMQISLFVNGVISLLAPWIIFWGGWHAACVCRVIQGLAQTGTYPATISMCAAWIPLNERSSLSTYIFSGTVIGTVVAFQVAGFLSTTPWGWPSIFWFTGILCLLTFVLITVFSSATPQDNKFISKEEKKYILGNTKCDSVKTTKVPWKAAFTSKHVWAIFATHIGSGVSFFFLFTQVPSYLHYILGFNVKESGLLSSLPYIANFFASLLFGFLSDYCCNRNLMSIKNTRKMYNSIACFGMATSLIMVTFFKSKAVAIACFIAALFAHAGIHVGWMVNYMDICPNYSSSLVAVGNTMMNVFMIIMPMIVSKVVVDQTNVAQWRMMLFLVSSTTIICNTIFVLFMSADVQPWNNYSYQLAAQDQEAGPEDNETKCEETLKRSTAV